MSLCQVLNHCQLYYNIHDIVYCAKIILFLYMYTESDDHFLNCETTKNTQLLHDHRHNNTRCLNSTHCKLTDTVNRENNVTYEYSMTLNKSLESDDSCLLLACSVDYDTTINNSRCVLYRHNCRENICDDITTGKLNVGMLCLCCDEWNL